FSGGSSAASFERAAQLTITFLVGRGLLDGRDSQIENSPFHRKALVFDAGTIAHFVSKNSIFLVQRWRVRKPLKLLVAALADLQGIFGTVSGAEAYSFIRHMLPAGHARNPSVHPLTGVRRLPREQSQGATCFQASVGALPIGFRRMITRL